MLHEATRRTIAFQELTAPMDRAEELQRLRAALRRVGKDVELKKIELYVCPTPDCPSYYGATGMPDLSVVNQHLTDLNYSPHPASTHHSRAQCPVCREAGKSVERVLVEVVVAVPVELVSAAPVV
jgi:hypothetical protein